jgi:hypothetical protein
MHEQDDGGTAANTLLKAIANSSRGYAFVGFAGNEEPGVNPTKTHGLVTLNVTENQMAAICKKGSSKRCSHPCDPIMPEGAGPWHPTVPPINNIHREYIQGVPGVFVQHPKTDPEREQILAYMTSGQDNLRGMEVFNSWVEQAWDAQVPLEEKDVDPLYPQGIMSMSMDYWDATLCALKRPIYGIADDDGFDYTGDSSETVYPHERKDTAQNDGPSWFRFGMGWSMVDVPDAKSFTAADIAKAVDKGSFYASTGLELEYNTTGDVISVLATEPVVFGVTGGGGEENGTNPLAAFNLTLCADPKAPGITTNVGCTKTYTASLQAPPPPPAAQRLVLDLTALPATAGSFFFVRVQAHVRRRYPIVSAPKKKAEQGREVGVRVGEKAWEFVVKPPAGAITDKQLRDDPLAGIVEGTLVRVAGGEARRPFLVHSVKNMTISCISHFSDDDDGEITPESGVQGSTTIDNIVPGQNQIVAERWAWMQPIFRRKVHDEARSERHASLVDLVDHASLVDLVDHDSLVDPFASATTAQSTPVGAAGDERPASAEWTVTTVAGSGSTDIETIQPCKTDPSQRVDGAANQSKFAAPTRAQVFDDTLYVLDGMNACIRSIAPLDTATPTVGSATPCCGTEIASGPGGNGPQDFHVNNDYFYILDSYNNQVKRVKRNVTTNQAFGKWELLAGNGSRPVNGQSVDGPAVQQALNEPHGFAVTSDGSGDVYIAETWSSCVRLLRDGQLTTIAGKCGFGGHANGAPADARFQHMHHVNLDPRDETKLYVSDVECYDDDRYPDDQKNRPCASTDGGVCFSGIRLIDLDRKTGKALRVSTVTGQVTRPHGTKKVSRDCNDWVDGNAKEAMFDYIHGTAFRPLDAHERALKASGQALNGSATIYVCDEDSNRIRSVDLATSISSTLAGSEKHGIVDGKGNKARFDYPGGIGLGPDGSIYVGDYEGSRVRKVAPPKHTGH